MFDGKQKCRRRMISRNYDRSFGVPEGLGNASALVLSWEPATNLELIGECVGCRDWAVCVRMS